MRVTPHFVKKAEGFNEEHLAAILDLDYRNHQDLQALACVCFTCFTGIRIEDLHQANTANVTRTASTTKNPRNWKIQLLKAKNDPDGTGPLENRTWLVPCCCLVEHLEKEAKQSFARKLKANPLVSCISPCPLFLLECPLPNDKYSNPSLFRALTSKGSNRTLTCNPLGISSIRDLTRLVNERLPINLQMINPSGHSGRVTLSSIAMNNNVGSVEVSAATKHKDPKSLLGYIRKDDGSLGAAALGVSNAIKKRGRDFSIASVEFDTDVDEEEEENMSSKSNVASNNIVNNKSTKKVKYSDGKNLINLTFDMREYHYDNNKQE